MQPQTSAEQQQNIPAGTAVLQKQEQYDNTRQSRGNDHIVVDSWTLLDDRRVGHHLFI